MWGPLARVTHSNLLEEQGEGREKETVDSEGRGGSSRRQKERGGLAARAGGKGVAATCTAVVAAGESKRL